MVVKRLLKTAGMANLVLLLLVIVLWGTVYAVNGLPGAYAWFVLKFAVPILGLAYILICTALLFIRFRKKKSRSRGWIGLGLGTVLFLHLLLTMNVIPLAYPARLQNASPAVTVSWPFAVKATVGWGGDAVNDNAPHAVWPSERWAYDLVMEPYGTGSTNPEDYGIWNREVLSPVAGTVISAYDAEPDISPGSEEILSMEGNHVYIQIEETGTYLLMNHLKQDSLQVKTGDTVKPGDVLGRVGNSGSTSEPHLHIHHQRQNPLTVLHPVLAEGLPLYFEGTDANPMPIKGTMVTPDFKLKDQN